MFIIFSWEKFHLAHLVPVHVAHLRAKNNSLLRLGKFSRLFLTRIGRKNV